MQPKPRPFPAYKQRRIARKRAQRVAQAADAIRQQMKALHDEVRALRLEREQTLLFRSDLGDECA